MMSAAKCTLPRAPRGALSRSTTQALAGALGSTAKCARPVRRSYGPVVPNAMPSANGRRSVMESVIALVMGASGGAGRVCEGRRAGSRGGSGGWVARGASWGVDVNERVWPCRGTLAF